MTLPKDLAKVRDEQRREFKENFIQEEMNYLLWKSYGDSFVKTYDEGFNAGFAAFRDSEMMREMVNQLEYTKSQYPLSGTILDKYRAWLGSENDT